MGIKSKSGKRFQILINVIMILQVQLQTNLHWCWKGIRFFRKSSVLALMSI